jgi:hypothetical protein
LYLNSYFLKGQSSAFPLAIFRADEETGETENFLINFFGVNKQWMKGLLLILQERAISFMPPLPWAAPARSQKNRYA